MTTDRVRVVAILSKSDLDGGATTALGDCASIDARTVDELSLTVRAAYHAAADAGVEVSVYCSADGTNYDTDAYTTFTPSFAAGETKQRTVAVTPGGAYVKVTVKNNDSSADRHASVVVTAVAKKKPVV